MERVWERWVRDPYFQYFTGEAFFQHALPHKRSSRSHWRKRIGILLAETPRVAHEPVLGARIGFLTTDYSASVATTSSSF